MDFPDPAEPVTVFTEQVWGNRYETKHDIVSRFTMIFDNNRTAALSPDDSVAFLSDLAHHPD